MYRQKFYYYLRWQHSAIRFKPFVTPLVNCIGLAYKHEPKRFVLYQYLLKESYTREAHNNFYTIQSKQHYQYVSGITVYQRVTQDWSVHCPGSWWKITAIKRPASLRKPQQTITTTDRQTYKQKVNIFPWHKKP